MTVTFMIMFLTATSGNQTCRSLRPRNNEKSPVGAAVLGPPETPARDVIWSKLSYYTGDRPSKAGGVTEESCRSPGCVVQAVQGLRLCARPAGGTQPSYTDFLVPCGQDDQWRSQQR